MFLTITPESARISAIVQAQKPVVQRLHEVAKIGTVAGTFEVWIDTEGKYAIHDAYRLWGMSDPWDTKPLKAIKSDGENDAIQEALTLVAEAFEREAERCRASMLRLAGVKQ